MLGRTGSGRRACTSRPFEGPKQERQERGRSNGRGLVIPMPLPFHTQQSKPTHPFHSQHTTQAQALRTHTGLYRQHRKPAEAKSFPSSSKASDASSSDRDEGTFCYSCTSTHSASASLASQHAAKTSGRRGGFVCEPSRHACVCWCLHKTRRRSRRSTGAVIPPPRPRTTLLMAPPASPPPPKQQQRCQ